MSARSIIPFLFALLCTPVLVAEAGVREKVGNPLQSAIAAADAGDYSGAMDLAKSAEVFQNLTDEELSDIAQTKTYIAAGKFTADYNARRYRDAIADEDLLIKFGALTDKNKIVIQQAYYLSGDYKGCARYASPPNTLIENSTMLQIRCIWEVNDNDFVRHPVLRLLVKSENAALAGCHDKAVTYWQAASAIGSFNPDEQSIVNRMERFVTSKASPLDGGEKCRDPKIDDDASLQPAG